MPSYLVSEMSYWRLWWEPERSQELICGNNEDERTMESVLGWASHSEVPA